MRMKRVISISLSLLALGLLPACETNHTQPLVRPPATAVERNFEETWAAARVVLRSYELPLYQQDKRDGILVTQAEPGGHLFELWRRDSRSLASYRENTVQTILRAARVTIRRIGTTDEFTVGVEIRTARTNRPQPNVTSSSQIYSARTIPLPRMTFYDLAQKPEAPRVGIEPVALDFITPLGRDSELEALIAKEISEVAAAGVIEYQPSAEAPVVTLEAEPRPRTLYTSDTLPEKKPEEKPEVKTEAKPEAKPEVKPEAKSETKPETMPEEKIEVIAVDKPVDKPADKPVEKPAETSTEQ